MEEPPAPIEIAIEAYDPRILDESVREIWQVANQAGARTVGPIPRPTQVDRYLVLRAVASSQMTRTPYEIWTHRRLLRLVQPNPQTLAALLELSLPAGVDIQITA